MSRKRLLPSYNKRIRRRLRVLRIGITVLAAIILRIYQLGLAQRKRACYSTNRTKYKTIMRYADEHSEIYPKINRSN
jgi:hypothetical protein